MPRSEGPFKILEKIGDNAFKLELPGDYGVSATFNVGDLAKYVPDEELQDLRTNSFEEEEDDTNHIMENFNDLVGIYTSNLSVDLESSEALHGQLLGFQSKVTLCMVACLLYTSPSPRD